MPITFSQLSQIETRTRQSRETEIHLEQAVWMFKKKEEQRE